MKKDSVEKDSFFSGISSVVKDYARINWPCMVLITATAVVTVILSLVKNTASPGGFNSAAFFSSMVYHVLLCSLVFFFCSRVYFPQGFEAREIATECFFYLLTYTLTVIGEVTGNFAGNYAICIIIPAVFCVYITAIIFGQLNALFFSIILSLAVLEGTSWGFLPFFYTLATCLAAARIVRTIKTRSAMVLVSVIQALVNVFFYEIIKFVFNHSFSSALYVIPGVAFNGFISGILCLGMLTPLEIILNTASPFRLLELSDMNSAVLKRLFSTAPGTYTHSVAVAQLAENACREINANALLARVASYYHDIGKMDNPEYFTENQGGEENLHDNLNPSLSVSIIRSHVRKGVEKARELRLPRQVINIISEHHGNQVISFFYNEAKQKDPSVTPEDYSYMGKPPSTKESAVVLLADTVEAACRSLQNKSVPSIEKFVDTLVKGKLESGQLNNSSLNFKEIDLIKKSFVQFLAGYYHSRVKYPDQKEEKETPETPVPEKKMEAAAPAETIKAAPSRNKSVTSETKTVSKSKGKTAAVQKKSASKKKTASKGE